MERIRQTRGYVLPMHEVLADDDPDFLDSYDAFYTAAMREDDSLPRKIKELIFVGVTIALGSPERVVAGHMQRALEHGGTEAEILGAVKLTTLSFAARALAAGAMSYQQARTERRKRA